jgi:hypothetical protein
MGDQGGAVAESSVSVLVRRMEDGKYAYGGDAGNRRLALLQALERRQLPSARAVERLHEFLCYLRAYPDNAAVLQRAERVLAGFSRRADLRRHRRALADTGIAGTATHYVFFWFTAQWLARRWPASLRIDWAAFDRKSRGDLEGLLHLLLPYSETPTIDAVDLPLKKLFRHLKGPAETDAAFLVRRFETIHPSTFGRETLYERIGVPLVLAPGRTTPSRTLAKHGAAPPVFQSRPLDRSRPDLLVEMKRPPAAIRTADPAEADDLITLAREAMVTRSRDLDNFIHADRRDVRVFDYADGLSFACYGLTPERRLLLESIYGMLTLKNGVPIGYVLASGLFGSSEVMYNVFETFRGGESARIYGRVLSMARRLFDADTFAIDPFQLGHANPEGQKSGAYWFYYKLGFRPAAPKAQAMVRAELQRLEADPGQRSSPRTLHRLAAEYVFLHAGRPRADVLGRVSLGNIGLHISRLMAARAGADRERAVRECARDAAGMLGVRSFAGWTPGERLSWERWSPLVLALGDVARWPAADRRGLVDVVRAKGGRRESDFVRLFDSHRRLRRGVLTLAANTGSRG